MRSLAAVGAHIGYIGAAAKIASPERRKRGVAGLPRRGRRAGRRAAGGAGGLGRGLGGPGRRHFPLMTNETTLAAC